MRPTASPNGRPWPGIDQLRPAVPDQLQGLHVAAHRVGVETALEGHRRGDAGQQVITGEQQTPGRRPQADVAERMPGRVDDFPAVAADLDLLVAAQPGRRLDHRIQVGQPAGEVVGQVALFVLGDAVVGVGVLAPGAGGVRMPVLLAVQVGHGVHRQVGAGQFHHPAGQPVVVDVRVRDDHPGDVVQGVAGALQARLHRGQPAVGQVRPPDPAVDDGDLVAVGQDVHVDALDGVDPDRQLHPGDARDRPRHGGRGVIRACVPGG